MCLAQKRVAVQRPLSGRLGERYWRGTRRVGLVACLAVAKKVRDRQGQGRSGETEAVDVFAMRPTAPPPHAGLLRLAADKIPSVPALKCDSSATAPIPLFVTN